MAAPIYGDVKYWVAEPLVTAADRVKKDADALEESRDKVKSETVPWSWLGLPSNEAKDRRDELVERMTTHLEGRRKVQQALYRAVFQVEGVELLVKEVEAQAESCGFRIAHDGELVDTRTIPQFDSWERDVWDWFRSGQREEISAKITTIVSLAADADATIIKSIPAGHDRMVDARGTVAPGVAARWPELTIPERLAIIKQLVEELAGIKTPQINWEHGLGSLGRWREDSGTIALDPDRFDDPDVLDTVVHELRHARQDEAGRDLDAKDDGSSRSKRTPATPDASASEGLTLDKLDRLLESLW